MDITDFLNSESVPDSELNHFVTTNSDWSDTSSSPVEDIKAAIAQIEATRHLAYVPIMYVASRPVYDELYLLLRTTHIDIYWDMALFPRTTRLAHHIRRARSRLHYRYLDWKHRNDPGYF